MEDAFSIPASLQAKIWVPDLHILGAKKSVIHSTISQNSALRLRRRGFLDLSLKYVPLRSYKRKIILSKFYNKNNEFQWLRYLRHPHDGIWNTFKFVAPDLLQ